MRKTPEEKVRTEPASLLKIPLWRSSVSAFANYQPPGFSVSGTSTPDGLF